MLSLLQRRRRWGGGRGACAPPQVLGYQLTLFGPRGADYARHITNCPPPIFLDDAASLRTIRIQIEKHHWDLETCTLLRGLTIDYIVQNFGFFFSEELTRKSKTIAYMEHLL